MKKFGLLFLLTVAMLALTGCPNNASTENGTTQPSSGSTIGGNTNIGTKISGLQANITVNAYMGDTQYNIQLNAEKGTFKAISLQPMIKPRPNQIIGRGDTDEEYDTITGTFVCNKTAAGDDLYWYAHNSAICLKPDTVTDSANTDKSCYKIIADLTKTSGINGTGTDNTVDVTNKYCTKNITSTEFTAAETAAKTAWDHSNDATSVTFTEEQKTCLKAADDILKTCTTKTVSDLTQDFNGTDYTVGFTFNIDNKPCDVFIDKNKVAISTDNTSDFSRTTPSWLMSAVNTVITSGASPDDIKNCDGLKDCTALQTVITELASAVGKSNDDVVYTESGKEGYQEMPCPWSEDELAKMKEFTTQYVRNNEQVGAICKSYKIAERFYNDDAFSKDADGKRNISELIYLLGWTEVSEILGENHYNTGEEHKFGVKITVDLYGVNNLIGSTTNYINPEILFDYFTFSAVDASGDEYEATPTWFIDAVTTYTDKNHSDYDRNYYSSDIGGSLSDIGSVWLSNIGYEYLNKPGTVNGNAIEMKFIFDVFEKDLTENTYPSTPAKMDLKTIKALVDSGDYAAYISDTEETPMSNYWDEYENNSLDSNNNPYSEHKYEQNSYTITFIGQSQIYIKKILYNVEYLQKNGDTLSPNGTKETKTISEIRQLKDAHPEYKSKVYIQNIGGNYCWEWTGNYDGNWEYINDNGELSYSSPSNDTVYFLQFNL